MATTAFTLRLPSEERAALETLSKIEGRPMNHLLNDAVKSYLLQSGKKERSLEENLERLRAYRKRDPEFKLAMAAFVEGELREDDPAEGVPVRGKFVDGQLVEAGPAQKKIREILNA
jgi:predicted DNA-binding protein